MKYEEKNVNYKMLCKNKFYLFIFDCYKYWYQFQGGIESICAIHEHHGSLNKSSFGDLGIFNHDGPYNVHTMLLYDVCDVLLCMSAKEYHLNNENSCFVFKLKAIVERK